MSESQPMPEFVPPAPASERARPARRAPTARQTAASVGRGIGAVLRRRWVAFAAGAAAMAVAALGLPAGVAALESATPGTVDELVDEYLAALDAGDAEGAVALAPPDETAASTALLTDAVYATASAVSIECDEPVQVDASRVEVSCLLSVGSVATMSLVHDDGGWRFARGLEQLMSTTGSIAPVDTVGGEPLPAAVADGREELWLLPGLYPVTTTADVRDDLQVTGGTWQDGATGFMGVSASPTLALTAEVTAFAEAHVAGCAEGAGGGAIDACPTVAPTTPGTAWSSVCEGQTWLIESQEPDADVHLTVLVQRFEAGVPGAVLPVVVTVPSDAEAGELEIEPDPERFVP